MALEPDRPFVDLCCGSGAVSLAAKTRGVRSLTMVDVGPWGIFWEAICGGTFDLGAFDALLDRIGDDPSKIQERIKALSLDRSSSPEVFIILQAAAFGSKAVKLRDGRWSGTWRSWWQPTATSSRRSPVNPMMPMPPRLRQRVHDLADRMGDAGAFHGDATTFEPPAGAVIYIDPPYLGTTGYGTGRFDVTDLATRLAAKHRVFVSEGRPLNDAAVQLHLGAKGGISGARRKIHQEWLTPFGTERL